MEPPYSSFHPENRLKVALPLIHPEFCKRLILYEEIATKACLIVRMRGSICEYYRVDIRGKIK